MTDVASRATRTPPRPRPAARRPPRVAVAVGIAALRAAAAGVLACEGLVLLAWVTDPRAGTGSGQALRTGLLAWLLGHGARVAVPGGAVGLPPLSLTILFGLLLFRAGRRVGRALDPAEPLYALGYGALVAVPYAALVALLAAPAGSRLVHPRPLRATVFAVLLAAACGAAGAAREVGYARYAADFPLPARAVARASAAAFGTLVAGAALGTAVALVAHLSRAAALARALSPGVAGGVVLVLLGVAYAPTAVAWCLAYGIGTGFAVGRGTLVAPTGVSVGALPAFPLLAALPGGGTAPRASLLLMAVPVIAGVVAALTLVRHLPATTPWRAAGWAALAGPAVGLAVVVLAVLSSGPAGPGRLGVTGPAPWLTGVAAAEWVGFVAAAAAGLVTWLRARPVSP